jgi:hypothetical protein
MGKSFGVVDSTMMKTEVSRKLRVKVLMWYHFISIYILRSKKTSSAYIIIIIIIVLFRHACTLSTQPSG